MIFFFFFETIDGLIVKQKDTVIVYIYCDISNITDIDTGGCQRSSKLCFKCGIFITLNIKAFKITSRRCRSIFIQYIYSAESVTRSNRFCAADKNSIEQFFTVLRAQGYDIAP